MKTDNSNEKDASLHALLKEWQPEASLPPRFRDQVWRRIERTEAALVLPGSLTTVVANWIANVLPKPALATAYVMVLLVIGASMGWRLARQKTARVTYELSARYVKAIDPHQATWQP